MFLVIRKNVGGDLYTYYGMQNDRTLISKHLVAVGDVSQQSEYLLLFLWRLAFSHR